MLSGIDGQQNLQRLTELSHDNMRKNLQQNLQQYTNTSFRQRETRAVNISLGPLKINIKHEQVSETCENISLQEQIVRDEEKLSQKYKQNDSYPVLNGQGITKLSPAQQKLRKAYLPKPHSHINLLVP